MTPTYGMNVDSGWLRWKWLILLFGILLPLYSLGWLVEGVCNRGVYRASHVIAAGALSLAWVSGLNLLRGIPWSSLARRRKFRVSASGLFLCLAPLLVGYVSSNRAHANLGVVVPRQVYRSRQMNAGQLAQAIERYKIQSILNLRGENLAAGWYHAEVATAARWHVAHYDYGFSAEHELRPERMDGLVALLSAVPKPVLIHCQAGADRAGLASALYLFALEGRRPDEAAAELSFWHGHVPFLYPPVRAMDISFQRYVSNRTPRRKLSLRPEPISP
jgi:protein-tyrosine phosphatase